MLLGKERQLHRTEVGISRGLEEKSGIFYVLIINILLPEGRMLINAYSKLGIRLS